MIRIRTIRRRVIAGALSLFVAAWLLITLVLVSGHDPALAARAASTQTATSTTQTATTSAGNSGSSTTTGSGSGAGATGVTTRQS